MDFLLDTNVISELTKPDPDRVILEWLNFHQDHESYLSVISIGEIQNGIVQLPKSKKQQTLVDWLNNEILVDYADRILNVDLDIMRLWGHMTAKQKKTGKTMQVMDSLIAATAKRHNLILVTRNWSDFTHTGIQIINPWTNTPD